MNRLQKWIPWRPTPVTSIAAAIVLAGVLLTGVSWWFLILVGVGTFGPGVLREMGWLHDKDEWQQRAAHRAGYHAFLVAGLVATVLVAFFRSGEREMHDSQELATLFLTLLWCTWFFSSLFGFWGAQKTATRVLLVFGCVWLVFIVLSNLGAEWQGPVGLLMSLLLAVPFFALAWVSRRWPRVAGVLLVAVAVGLSWLFGLHRKGPVEWVDQAVVVIAFLGPLLASGVALLGVRAESDESSELA